MQAANKYERESTENNDCLIEPERTEDENTQFLYETSSLVLDWIAKLQNWLQAFAIIVVEKREDLLEPVDKD